jgi:DNA processing protein
MTWGKLLRKLGDDELPQQLREIPQPPKELWVAGELPSPETVLLTVVGARKHSPYGKEACEALIHGLRGHDIAIISGLALGIDSIAHDAAMTAGLMTLAVPGSGLDTTVLYPRSNVRLAERIVASGGGLLSEFAPTTTAAPWTFPKRNRIMAGLAVATLIVEAEAMSGTLITTRLATDYNRDVFAVPGSIFSPLSYGPNKLIELGATPIHESDDILRALGFTIDKDTAALDADFSHLEGVERQVMELLSFPKRRDILISELGLETSDGNILLMKMEMNGLIIDSAQGIRRG